MTSVSWIDRARVYFNFLGKSSENLERLLRSGVAISRISQHAFDLQQKTTGEHAIRINNSLCSAWNLVYISRIPCEIGEMVTLSTFVETHENGSLKLTDDKKHYQWREKPWVVAKISLFVARILCLVTTLHEARACYIQHNHLRRLYLAIASIWTIAAAGAFYLAVKNILTQPFVKENYMKLVKTTFDFSAMIFDITRKTNSASGIVSGVLNLGAGVSALAYEFFWHRPV